MSDSHVCYMCGRYVTPCANCGGTSGFMIQANNHSEKWIHKYQVDCIVQLNSDLERSRARIAELESFLSAYDDRPEEATHPAPPEEAPQ